MSQDYFLCIYENQKYLCGAKDKAERQECKGFSVFNRDGWDDCHYWCPNNSNTCQHSGARFEACMPQLKKKGTEP
jgi:hypothetical protein